jgi:hypothetical protein
MIFIPYKSVFGIEFESTPEQIAETLGKPVRAEKTAVWAHEMQYKEKTLRFNQQKKCKEVSADLPQIEIDGEKTPFKQLKTFIKNNDDKSFETVGFIVSPKYGMAFDPHFKSWVTFFAKSELKNWYD